MSEQVFQEIKNVISVLSLLQLREKTFREELEFFKSEVERILSRVRKQVLCWSFKAFGA